MHFLLSFLFILPISSHAEIYQWIDQHNQLHFSDSPKPGAKTISITPSHSFYHVTKVYDGDTVLLSNGEKIRLLGINAPEVEGRRKAGQPGGEEAKQWLKKLLDKKKVRKEQDIDKKDKYHRVLAHLFTKDDTHINLELVQHGLASVNIHPPNLKYADKLFKAEQSAEHSKLGIWQRKAYFPKRVSELNRGNYKGWQRVIGTISKIKHSRKYIKLVYSEHFELMIKKNLVPLFPDIENYLNHSVESRGWINKRKNHYVMFIKHPYQLIIK